MTEPKRHLVTWRLCTCHSTSAGKGGTRLPQTIWTAQIPLRPEPHPNIARNHNQKTASHQDGTIESGGPAEPLDQSTTSSHSRETVRRIRWADRNATTYHLVPLSRSQFHWKCDDLSHRSARHIALSMANSATFPGPLQSLLAIATSRAIQPSSRSYGVAP